uniref:Uncharacterized protein n=1 Tax=Trichogramma kaykai TaxID=54128 RepID=A0ABD2W1T2_9HYME
MKFVYGRVQPPYIYYFLIMVSLDKCSDLEKLKSLRENSNYGVKEERVNLFLQLNDLFRQWKDQLPNLGEIFKRVEIDWLLTVSVSDNRYGEQFIKFVAMCGYEDKPDVDKNGKPLLCRTTPIHYAARSRLSNRNTVVGELFKIYNKFNANYTDKVGVTHLHVACGCGLIEVVKKFIEFRQDLNCLGRIIVDPPMQWALLLEQKDIAELLLINGANPNVANISGTTPLHAICQRKQDDNLINIFYMINNNLCQTVLVNVFDKLGRTPLQLALARGHKNVVKTLLRYGADLNLANAQGVTPIRYMCNSNYHDYLANILHEISEDKYVTIPIDTRDNKGNTALHVALIHNRMNVAEMLIRNGADPHLVNEEGLTPLHIVSKKEDDDGFFARKFCLICEMFDHPLQFDAEDKLGNTSLHLALQCARLGVKNIAELLLRLGADPNMANKNKVTPLHIICKRDRDDGLAKIFFDVNEELSQLVLVDVQDKLGRTPLQWAVAKLLPDVVDELLNHGADISSFVFPTETYFAERSSTPESYELASSVMAVVERLEKQGYELNQSDATTIIKLFVKYELFKESTDLENDCYEDEEFTEAAKTLMMNSSLSLYNLIRLRPGEAAKQLTCMDYYKLKFFMFFHQIEVYTLFDNANHCHVRTFYLTQMKNS